MVSAVWPFPMNATEWCNGNAKTELEYTRRAGGPGTKKWPFSDVWSRSPHHRTAGHLLEWLPTGCLLPPAG